MKTGQVYQFYADLHKLYVLFNHLQPHTYHVYAFPSKMDKVGVHPPRSLTSALGREVEKYDQLCDAMETHIASLCPYVTYLTLTTRSPESRDSCSATRPTS